MVSFYALHRVENGFYLFVDDVHAEYAHGVHLLYGAGAPVLVELTLGHP